jgi:hydroxymethylbilane synthase
VQAERAFLRRLEGGCQVPIAAYAVLDGFAANATTPRIRLRGLVGTTDGMQIVRGEREAPINSAQTLGRELAEELLRAGADEILQRLSRSVPAAVAPEEV